LETIHDLAAAVAIYH
jgi:hypothetical protein